MRVGADDVANADAPAFITARLNRARSNEHRLDHS
jgi:hypothetical protein